jgi:hypothetical protein
MVTIILIWEIFRLGEVLRLVSCEKIPNEPFYRGLSLLLSHISFVLWFKQNLSLGPRHRLHGEELVLHAWVLTELDVGSKLVWELVVRKSLGMALLDHIYVHSRVLATTVDQSLDHVLRIGVIGEKH